MEDPKSPQPRIIAFVPPGPARVSGELTFSQETPLLKENDVITVQHPKFTGNLAVLCLYAERAAYVISQGPFNIAARLDTVGEAADKPEA
jgi:hypothetical protein